MEESAVVECPATPEILDQCPTPDIKPPSSPAPAPTSSLSSSDCKDRNTASPLPNCAICLGRCKNQCYTDACDHHVQVVISDSNSDSDSDTEIINRQNFQNQNSLPQIIMAYRSTTYVSPTNLNLQLPTSNNAPIEVPDQELSSSSDDCIFVSQLKPPELRTPELVTLNSDSDSDVVFVDEVRNGSSNSNQPSSSIAMSQLVSNCVNSNSSNMAHSSRNSSHTNALHINEGASTSTATSDANHTNSIRVVSNEKLYSRPKRRLCPRSKKTLLEQSSNSDTDSDYDDSKKNKKLRFSSESSDSSVDNKYYKKRLRRRKLSFKEKERKANNEQPRRCLRSRKTSSKNSYTRKRRYSSMSDSSSDNSS